MNLDDFLSAKPLFYDVIDVDRFPQAYTRISGDLSKPDIIHVVGTNGKGSTGRFLATALHRAGKRVGHYTSPHIMRFNERIWIDGSEISGDALEAAHVKLSSILDANTAERLSYFEYTTLLAMVAYEGCDYVVLEAGLGGEYDATNVFDKVLSVFTPIDFDHAAFLGTTIDSVAGTKLRSMQHFALIGKQKHPEVETIARTVADEKGCALYGVEERSTSHIRDIASRVAIKNGLSDYLRDNLELAMCAYELLGHEAQETLFDQDALFGRLSRIAPNVTLDVGHNPLAAREIARAYAGKKVTLVYNTYRDKDYREILSILSPVIETVEIIDVDDVRIAERGDLEAALKELSIPYASFEAVKQDKEYLIFGSFSVAEAFLKRTA
ncbi:MAG: folylpolyglutamate synthase [Sulfuricurvum sp. MLSB]|uniref:bifunctional folylpolyglutamate synthase/dihydrofolate synthase n=1 Tax=unclassified Sulfuricurvum TaxID=2632390 RepID=UPI000506D3F9|nr:MULTISPECIES: Mur ligase family protein [unclassified Sulfuricurvum]KFN38463.1 MAG: folylpolyglutamate synthase [Sulfuricurvum sp. MLSB]